MKFSEIYDNLFNEWYSSNINNIEKYLKNKVRKETDPVIRQELMLMLLVTLLRKNTIETTEMSELFSEFEFLSRQIESKLVKLYRRSKDKISKMYIDVFYRTNIYRLFTLERLYSNLNISYRTSMVRVLRKDFQKNEAFSKGKYSRYVWMLLDKLFSNYWTSFWHLLYVIIITVFFFWLSYFAVDGLTWDYLVWWNWQLERLDYYMYISLATFSNLWADTSMAWTILLRILFGFEQVIWLIVFWIFVILIGKKFD